MDIEKIIRAGETETVEFKASLAEKKQILETISAFSNTEGGTILIGVDDEGSITGVQLGRKTLEDLANRIKNCMDPVIYPSISKENVNGKNIIQIVIEESDIKPVFANDRAFKRVGKTNQRVSSLEIRRMASEISLDRWDSSLCENSTIEDLDWRFIETVFIPLYERIAKKQVSGGLPELLASLGCVMNKRPTNGGILLFGKDPTKFFINSYVAIGRYIGPQEGPERLDYKEFNGNLFTQIDKTEEYLRDHTAIMSRLLPGVVQRQNLPEYGLFTLRELVTNAVCHRDYMNQHTKVIIKMFDDRIEFFNPGGLPKGITPKNITESQFSRNPIIAKVLSKVSYIEELGEGWNKIVAEHKVHPLSPELPTITSDEYTTMIRVYSVRSAFVEEKEIELNQRQKIAFEYIQKNGKITNKEYRGLFPDISDRTVLNDLRDMMSKTLIIRRGKRKGAYYIIPK